MHKSCNNNNNKNFKRSKRKCQICSSLFIRSKSVSPAHTQEGYHTRAQLPESTDYLVSIFQAVYTVHHSKAAESQDRGKTLKATGAKTDLIFKRIKLTSDLKILKNWQPNIFRTTPPHTHSHTKHCLSLGQNKYQNEFSGRKKMASDGISWMQKALKSTGRGLKCE